MNKPTPEQTWTFIGKLPDTATLLASEWAYHDTTQDSVQPLEVIEVKLQEKKA